MSRFDDIAELTRRLVVGDSAAIKEFYERYFELMFREAAFASGGDEATCLDIVQDSLLKMLRCIKPMQTEEQLRCWTRKLVKSVAVDSLRKRRSQLNRERIAAREPNASSNITELEQIQARLMWLEESLSKLAPDQRRLLSLRYRVGWTLQKIADSLGMKAGAVDGRIRRLVDQLRQQAEASDYE